VKLAAIALLGSILSWPAAAAADSLIDRLLRIAGLTAAPTQMRGPGDSVTDGNLWIAARGGTPAPLTSGGGYRSPVFEPDGSVLALKGNALLRIAPQGGGGAPVHTTVGVLKLVGFDSGNADELFVLLDGGFSPLGVLSMKSGKITPLPYDGKSDAQREMLAQIRGQDRVYGNTLVYLKTETKQGLSRKTEWTDVYVKRGDAAAQNVSRCDGVSCGQPAMSADGQRIAFVMSGGP